MEGIKDTRLDAVKSQILESADLRRYFPACVTLYKDFVKATANVNGNLQISAVVGGGSDGNGNIPVEDCWYKEQEWKDLGEKGRAAAIKIRAEMKGPNKPSHQGKKTFTNNKATESKVAELEKKVKNQRRKLAAMEISTSVSDSNDSNGEEEEPMNDSGSNRNHSAVTCQGQGHKKKNMK